MDNLEMKLVEHNCIDVNLRQDVKETDVKTRYNIKKRIEKRAAYRDLISVKLADSLYEKIFDKIIIQKKYKEPNYLAKDLARDLDTNTRYLSAVINSRFGKNYASLVNQYRVRDALHLLLDKRYASKSIEEISALVGFANRQSFYSAFYRNIGIAPNDYRKKHEKK